MDVVGVADSAGDLRKMAGTGRAQRGQHRFADVLGPFVEKGVRRRRRIAEQAVD